MATVINNPGNTTSDDGAGVGLGMIVGIILAVVVIALLAIYGIPALRISSAPTQPAGATNINVTLPNPAPSTGTTNP